VKHNIKDIKRIILHPFDGEKTFLIVVLKNGARYLAEFDEYRVPYYSLEELVKTLRYTINDTRIGYLFMRTAEYDILQLFDGDDQIDYSSAQSYLQDKVEIDNIWNEKANKNFSITRMLPVTHKSVSKNVPTIYFNIL
jgi:hypothetical protein